MKNETAQDLKNERDVMQRVAQKWKCDFYKNPCPPYRADWSLVRGGEIIAMCEVKCREKKYPTLVLSLDKVLSLISYAKDFVGVRAVLVIRWPDGIFFTELYPLPEHKIKWFDNHRQTSPCDSEPVIDIPVKIFKRICD